MKKHLLPSVLTIALLSFQLIADAQVANPEKVRVPLVNTTYNVVVDDADATQPATQASALVDGDPNTYWETSWHGVTPLPHWAVIDMKASQSLDGVYIIDRPNPGNSPYSIDVFTTNQSDTTGGATWVQQGTTWFPGYDGSKAKLFFAFSTAKDCQYLKLVVTQNGGVSGNTNQVTNIAEIGAWQWSIPDPNAYDRSGWSILSFSSEDNNDPGLAPSALDNNPSTYWQSQWASPAAPFPHTMVIDMGASIPINQIAYSQRMNNYSGQVDSGTVAFSADNVTWTAEIPLRFSYHALDGARQLINLPSLQNGRYMRLTMVRNYWDFQNPLVTPDPSNATSVATAIGEIGAGYDAVLPVTVYGFSGSLSNGVATLKWNSGVEDNFKQYELEYSVDGVKFKAGNIINAKGSNSQYTSSIVQTSTNAYYRLKLVEIDGSYTYANRIIRLSQTISNNITIYPNPAKSIVRITVAEKGVARIYTVSGSLMKTLNLEPGINKVSIQDFSIGIYYVLVNGHKARFIKE